LGAGAAIIVTIIIGLVLYVRSSIQIQRKKDQAYPSSESDILETHS
jgi:hypothetical protein